MMRKFVACLIVCALSASFGCSKEEKSEPKPAAADHAPAGVKAGSHEDWCGEHAVPESQCTLCHPDLIAAFKATGDWCEEHSLPESHCLKCNPNLKITRPPKIN
jgi:hypothetical protein